MARRKSKRGRPFGTIFQRGDRWVFSVGLEGKRHWRTFDSEEEAKLYRARLEQKRLRGETIEEFDPNVQRKRRTLLAEFVEERWLPYAKQRVRAQTFDGYSTVMRVHVLPTLGDYPLAALTTERLDEFFSDWAAGGPDYKERAKRSKEQAEERWRERIAAARAVEERRAELEGRPPRYVMVPRKPVRNLGRSAGTLQNGVTALRAMLGCAVKWGYIPRNPAEGIERPRGEHEEMRPLALEEVERLLASLDNDEHREAYLIVVTAISTGVRRGELFALRWGDFDSKRRRLWVRRSVDRHGTIQEPKTRRSTRAIGLPPSIVQALLEHRMASSRKGDADLIFPNEKGGVQDACNFVRREFKPALKRAGVPDVRFHDLRHTFASLLIQQGVHPKIISEQLGHASIQITMDRYSHLYDTAAIDAGDAMQAAIFGSSSAAQAEAL